MITVVSVLVNKSPEHLIVGLSAFAAVLLLIFKDSILGFVAGIQLTSNNMIRIGDYHTVVVLEKKENSVMVTEGNYNSSIHWGREITRSSLEREGFSVRTRYPA